MDIEKKWLQLEELFNLSREQMEQCKEYARLLLEHNEHCNLTAITQEAAVIKNHFYDSLILSKWIDLSLFSALADVGSGAGFPALPLKIAFPHLSILLIEMNKKRQAFLRTVCEALSLQDVEIAEYDWRTFLRVTQGEIPLFVARASLSVPELCRLFKPACSYNKAQLIYWASAGYEPEEKIIQYRQNEYEYKVGSKHRRLIQFAKSNAS